MTPLTARQAEHRLVLLTVTRWLPTGAVFGLTVLLPLERGLSLVEVGTLVAIGGAVVLGLELPTGGLADAIGRRPVLIAASAVAVVSTLLFAAASTYWMFAVAAVLQGVFRALDSGPLEAWFVDTVHSRGAVDAVPRGLSRSAAALGTAIAVGALIGGGLVAWHPFATASALLLPYAVAVCLYAAHAVLVTVLVREPPRRPEGPERRGRAGRSAVRAVPGAIAEGLLLLRRSAVLRCLILVEVFWSLAMVAFETLTPVRLSEILSGPDAAGALFGPASAAAWALFAIGAWVSGPVSRRIGVAWTAILARVLNGLFIVGMGLAAGVVGLLAAYSLAYLTHGFAGPMHNALLHRQASATNRAAVLSMNSTVAGGSFSIGVIALTALAETASTSVAVVVAGAVSVVGAVLYLPAVRQARSARVGSPIGSRHASD